MIGFVTEINLKTKTVKTTFRGESRTFGFNYSTFTLLQALHVATEDAHNQILEWMQDVVARVESAEVQP